MSTKEKIALKTVEKEVILAETKKIEVKGRWGVNVREADRNKIATVGIVIGGILLIIGVIATWIR